MTGWHRGVVRRAGAAMGGTVAATTAAVVLVTAAPALADVGATPARTWGTNGRVDAILPLPDGSVVVGGDFTAVIDTAGNSYPVSDIARYLPATGGFDLSWQAGANGVVTALAASPDGTTVYLGGSFSKVDGVDRGKLAAVSAADGSLRSWAPTTDVYPDALATAGGSVFAAGLFTTVTDATGTYPRPYAAKLDGTTGALDPTWAPTFAGHTTSSGTIPGRVRALAVTPDGSRIFVGGDFVGVSGKPGTNKVAALSTGTGAVDPNVRVGPNNRTNYATVYDLATDGSTLLEAVGGAGGACTAISAASGGLRWSKRANGNLQSVRMLAGTAYCGGHFGGATSFEGANGTMLPRYKLAAVDLASGTTTAFAPNINSPLGTWSLGVAGTRVFVGGDFDRVSGVAQPHLATFVDSTSVAAPAAPALSGTGADTVVHLAWAPPSTDNGSAVTGYTVYRQTGSGGWSKRRSLGAGATTYDDTGVTNGTTYGYQVTATNAVGESAPSNPVTVTPAPVSTTVPGAPGGVVATGGQGLATVTWSAPASDGNSPITGYQIYRGTAAGTETPIASVDASTRSYSDRAIRAGTTYWYEVTALNAVGESAPSSEASATPTASKPGPVQNLTGTASNGGVHLSWDPPGYDGGSAVLKYVIVRDGVQVTGAKNLPATQLSWDDTAVTPGQPYDYQVKAVNAVGGTLSATVTVTP